MLFPLFRLTAYARADKLLQQRFAHYPQFLVPFIGIPILRLYVDRFAKAELIREFDLSVDTAVVVATSNFQAFQPSAVSSGISFE